MDAETWFFALTTVLSIGLTVHYGMKSTRLENERKKLDWADLQSSANDLASQVKKVFTPDAIFTPGLRGATVANLLVEEFDRFIPVFVGVSSWRDESNALNSCIGHFCIQTKKWYVHIPEALCSYSTMKLLVVDDFAMSGDFLEQLRDALVSKGFNAQSIKTLTVATTEVAIQNRKAPDFWWMKTSSDRFYFPWGRAR